MLMWVMSDRGIPRSYRTMEGFGVHTFRLVNADGETVLVKFHWKPAAGVHSLVWEEAQIAAGADPDFHRRDLADAIEAGAFPEWELGAAGLRRTPRTRRSRASTCSTRPRSCRRSSRRCRSIGTMTLNANPTNYFAETEQVAFHTGHLVPGIEVTDDPLLQGRMFSYLDTQLTRLGGPNFTQLPINRPHAPVNDMLRDGMHQTAVHEGVAPYLPNSLDGGEPKVATDAATAPTSTSPTPVEGDEGAGQPGVVRRPLQPGDAVLEQHDRGRAGAHRRGVHLRARQVLRAAGPRADAGQRWRSVDADLCAQVAAGLGLPAPAGEPAEDAELVAGAVADRRRRPARSTAARSA